MKKRKPIKTRRTEKGFSVVLMRTDDKHYLVVNEDNSVAARDSVEKYVEDFESLYNRKHAFSYEGSMSACINYLFMQPSVVWFDSVDSLRLALFAGAKDEDLRVCEVRCVAGGFRGLICGAGAGELWEKGRQPLLISDGFYAALAEAKATRRGER
jgi:hypothetical protein